MTFIATCLRLKTQRIEGVEALKGEVFGGMDIKLTTASIDALCKEAINDTERAVEAVKYLVSRGELHSATQRLMEAFFIGENLAPIKTFPMDAKREIMRYMRDTDKLINAVKVKHVERAEEILKEILTYVKDFDTGQIEAFIETSRQLSNLALQRALVCAQSKNQPGVEAGIERGGGILAYKSGNTKVLKNDGKPLGYKRCSGFRHLTVFVPERFPWNI